MNKERGGYSDLQPFLCLDRREHYKQGEVSKAQIEQLDELLYELLDACEKKYRKKNLLNELKRLFNKVKFPKRKLSNVTNCWMCVKKKYRNLQIN